MLFYVSTVNNSVGVFVGKKYFNSKVFAGLLNLKGEGKNIQSKPCLHI